MRKPVAVNYFNVNYTFGNVITRKSSQKSQFNFRSLNYLESMGRVHLSLSIPSAVHGLPDLNNATCRHTYQQKLLRGCNLSLS